MFNIHVFPPLRVGCCSLVLPTYEQIGFELTSDSFPAGCHANNGMVLTPALYTLVN